MKKNEVEKIVNEKLKCYSQRMRKTIEDAIVDIIKYYFNSAQEEFFPFEVNFEVGLQDDVENKYFELSGQLIFHDANQQEADYSLEINVKEIDIDEYIDMQLNVKKLRREYYDIIG